MNLLVPPLPPFRIEAAPLDKSGDLAKAPWSLFGTASTDSQAKQKVESLMEIHPDYVFRAVPNEWQTENLVSLLQEKLDRNDEFRQNVIRQCGSDDINFLADAVFLSKAADKKIGDLKAQLKEAKALASQVATPPAEVAKKFPFAVGDHLEDTHSGTIVRVTAVGEKASKGNGFDWVLDDGDAKGMVGHCPKESMEYFAPIKKKTTAAKTSAPKKKTQPRIRLPKFTPAHGKRKH